MNRGIYATATGMIAAQQQLDVLSNNLANVSTNGFKRDGIAFAERFEREMLANGGRGASLGTLGTGAVRQAQFTIFEAGPLNATGNPLDVAINDKRGLFAVQTSEGVRYTRDGSFQLNDSRQIVTHEGYPLLDDRLEPITLPVGKPSVESNGTVMVDGVEVGKIALFDGAFTKIGDNLFEASNPQVLETPNMKGGHIEGSNVNPVESMIGMITLNRAFELAQRSIQQQDDLTQRLIQSLRD